MLKTTFKILSISSLLLISLSCSAAQWGGQLINENDNSFNLLQSLIIIKPNAVKKDLQNKINAKFSEKKINIVASKKLKLSKKQAQAFYSTHKDKPFYDELVNFMSSNPIIVEVIEGEDIIERSRTLIGNTDPAKAEADTIRKIFGENKTKNSIHGSDSEENAKHEISFFFATFELLK